MIADCMFSGEATSNDEHIIPRWMQRRYHLGNQTYHLPNATTIRYKHARIPVAERHNTSFSRIEGRVADGVATPPELYLWALKIHIGLIYKDANLKFDITDPSGETFWDVSDFAHEVAMFRMLYEVWNNDGSISPSPFGTVLQFDALTRSDGFDFIHELQSGTICFQLGRKALFVSLWDQADGLEVDFNGTIERYHRPFVQSQATEDQDEYGHVALRVFACETAYELWRLRRKFNFIKTDKSFTLLKSGRRTKRPANREELARFCRSFGLELAHFGGEAGHQFRPWNPSSAS
jgi:hypothetical protein